ncbi:MAG TPA: hypothetical protein HA360_03645 [Nanoarchaeota archaeon]|nr:hypothetical protein [Candidatus Woesearchaeota archaeon]HIH14631.1 hypothetical protein [Nanoarchaeota archaeon]HIH59181.1 hypothetical protein [Nanoarchaeota archaeon]HII14141.1 hypothetical protein [Nanoarchaeota archaeon]HIJ05593.1 hypothetical protein [Nanoarchaeota archaeon]
MVQKNNSPLKNIFYVGSIGGISLFTGLCAAYYQSPEVPIIADPEVEKDVVLAQEFTLMSQSFVPEEFYIKLYQSDDFLPAEFVLQDCYRTYSDYYCKKFKDFSSLDGKNHQFADIYSFAIQGIKSGHRPHNRRNTISPAHDQFVTWLDAVRTLTRLQPENEEDQDLIRSWIAANYTTFTDLENVLDQSAIQFISNGKNIQDIAYTGKNKDLHYRLPIYTSGRYNFKIDNAWLPSDEKEEEFTLSSSQGHLILPVSNDPTRMLIIPDYLLREDREQVSTGVYIGKNTRGKGIYSKYTIRLEEINAELSQLIYNRSIGIRDGSAQTIITPTLELIVKDIVKDKIDRSVKLVALLDSLEKEAYSDSSFNSPPLVTFVAGGQCGATSGQFAAMLQLAGISYTFIEFPWDNHIGVSVPKEEGKQRDISLHPEDYWYIETTNGRIFDLSSLPNLHRSIPHLRPKVYDLRPQLSHLPSAQLVQKSEKDITRNR